MAVDDAGHDELAAQVHHVTFVRRKACLIAYIDEFAILDGQGRGKGTLAVRREDFCVFDDFVCFHGGALYLLFVSTSLAASGNFYQLAFLE
jgi:hypothetical protein